MAYDVFRNLEIDSVIDEYRKARGLGVEYERDDVFGLFATEAIVAQFTKSTFDPNHIFIDGAHDTGIDGLAIIIDDEIVETEEAARVAFKRSRQPEVRLVLVQATTEKRFDQVKVEKFLSGARDFFRDQVRNPKKEKIRNKDVKEAAGVKNVIFELLRDAGASLPQLLLYYVAAGHWRDSPPATNTKNKWISELRKLRLLRKVAYEWVDVTDIIELRRRFRMRNRGSLRSYKMVELPAARKAEVAYLGAILADDIIDLVADDGGNGTDGTVFLDNVRDFLGRNPVNAEIARTIDDGDLELFALLSNGVTIVCRQCDPVADRFCIYDYQIVNGCQTSNVLYDKRAKVRGKGVLVPAKLVVSRDPDTVRRIIEAANRQSEITKENLLALLPFNRRLANFYGAMRTREGAAPLYYEVRQGEHAAVADQAGTYIIDVRDQIQTYAAMFLGRPHAVSAQLASLFAEIKDDQLLSERHRPDFYYLAGLALYRFEALAAGGQLDKRYANARFYFLHLIAQRHFRELFESELRYWSDAIEICRDLIERYSVTSGGLEDYQWAAGIIDKAVGGRDLTPQLAQTKGFLDQVNAEFAGAGRSEPQSVPQPA